MVHNKKKENKNQGKRPQILTKQKKSLFRMLKMIKKEFRLLWTDKFNLFLALILPPGIVLLMAATMSTPASATPIECVIVSYDSNTFMNPNNFTESKLDNYSHLYINAVNKSNRLDPILPLEENASADYIPFFNASNDIYAMETARNYLLDEIIVVIIVIPSGFSEMLSLGLPGMIECIPDSSKIMKIQDNLNAVQDSIKIFLADNNLTPQFLLTGFEQFAIPEGFSLEFNFMISFILPIMTFGLAMVLTILVVVKEKPIARLLLTPVQRSEILLSKYLTYIGVLVAQTSLLIGAALLNGLYIVGSLFDLFIALFILGFNGIALGLLISSQSKTKTEANQYFFMSFIVIIILSGIFIPIGAMPLYLQVIAWVLPLSHSGPMLEGILSKGNSFLGFDFFCLLAVGVVLFILSFIIFYRKQYEA